MPGSYIFNDKFYEEDQPSIHPDNRSFRYGDGVFETIRVTNGNIPLWNLHMDRLFSSLDTLKFKLPRLFGPEMLLQQSANLLKRNKLSNARLRINVSRGEGGILEPLLSPLEYCIQTWPLEEARPRFNQNGLQLALYKENKKATGPLSNLKSNNYLIYAMAATHAREQKCNDAIILNHHGNVCDTTIANICWVREGRIFTAPPQDGPVNGVMLQYLQQHMPIGHESATPEKLVTADEVFITNAVRGIQWVGRLDDFQFQPPQIALGIYNEIITPLFS